MSIQRRAMLVALIMTLTLFASSANSISAQVTSSGTVTIIPLEALDPVMLVNGKEVPGVMRYKVVRGQFEYVFANAENKAIFEKDPARYEIQLNGLCARMGAPTSGDPDLYAVHSGHIYLFGSPECRTLFKAAPEKYLEVAPPPKPAASAEMVKRGQELIAKAVEATGGPLRLDQLVSFQRKDVRGNDIKSTLLLGFPGGVRLETVRPNFTVVTVVTPTESFLLVNDRANSMPETTRTFISREINREPIMLLRARTRPAFRVYADGNGQAGETMVERVDVELDGFTTTLGIDPATGRVLSQTYRGRGPGSVLGQIVINYSDFRTVEGMSLPFKAQATFDGQHYPALSRASEAMTVNGQVDPASFKRPSP